MDPDGKNLVELTDRSLYETLVARDTLNPNGTLQAFNAPDPNNPEVLQIWLRDLTISRPPMTQLTILRKGLAFAPSWSPTEYRIAFTSSETGPQEIYSVDVETKRPRQLTVTTDWYWNQYPSWSPDGKRIVFDSDRGHTGTFTEIWVMNADGSGAFRLLDWGRDAWSPIWIKWRQ